MCVLVVPGCVGVGLGRTSVVAVSLLRYNREQDGRF